MNKSLENISGKWQWRNLDFNMWMKETNASGLSQEQLKLEATKFSKMFSNIDKKTISKVCDIFEKEDKLVLKAASHAIFEVVKREK